LGETNCPYCGVELADGGTIAGRKHPGRDDISICRECAEIVILGDTGKGVSLRPATASEYLELPEEAQTLLRVAFELVKGRRRRRPTRQPRHLN
jgi:hypothetical protein